MVCNTPRGLRASVTRRLLFIALRRKAAVHSIDLYFEVEFLAI